VNSRLTVLPGTTGSSVKLLVRIGGPTTSRESVAGAPSIGVPPTTAVMTLVVLP
jgi:hypothetical protein